MVYTPPRGPKDRQKFILTRTHEKEKPFPPRTEFHSRLKCPFAVRNFMLD